METKKWSDEGFNQIFEMWKKTKRSWLDQLWSELVWKDRTANGSERHGMLVRHCRLLQQCCEVSFSHLNLSYFGVILFISHYWTLKYLVHVYLNLFRVIIQFWMFITSQACFNLTELINIWKSRPHLILLVMLTEISLAVWRWSWGTSQCWKTTGAFGIKNQLIWASTITVSCPQIGQGDYRRYGAGQVSILCFAFLGLHKLQIYHMIDT